jgi:serine/threonine protein kinase
VLFELIAGRHPFRGQGLEETLKRVRRASVPDVRQWAPECPEAVARYFARALHRDPRRRPASATALAQELRELINQLP